MKERKNKNHEKSKELDMLNYGRERLKKINGSIGPVGRRKVKKFCIVFLRFYLKAKAGKLLWDTEKSLSFLRGAKLVKKIGKITHTHQHFH